MRRIEAGEPLPVDICPESICLALSPDGIRSKWINLKRGFGHSTMCINLQIKAVPILGAGSIPIQSEKFCFVRVELYSCGILRNFGFRARRDQSKFP